MAVRVRRALRRAVLVLLAVGLVSTGVIGFPEPAHATGPEINLSSVSLTRTGGSIYYNVSGSGTGFRLTSNTCGIYQSYSRHCYATLQARRVVDGVWFNLETKELTWNSEPYNFTFNYNQPSRTIDQIRVKFSGSNVNLTDFYNEPTILADFDDPYPLTPEVTAAIRNVGRTQSGEFAYDIDFKAYGFRVVSPTNTACAYQNGITSNCYARLQFFPGTLVGLSNRVIKVGDRTITYTAYGLSTGMVNVGRITVE